MLSSYYRLRSGAARERTPLRVALQHPWPGTLRGFVLWLFALAVGALGVVNYALNPLPDTSADSLQYALVVFSATTWGWIMASVGAVGAFCSYCHRNRDQFGYALLAAFCGIWGAFQMTAYLFGGASTRAIGGALVWGLLATALALIAGFPNVPLKRTDRPGA